MQQHMLAMLCIDGNGNEANNAFYAWSLAENKANNVRHAWSLAEKKANNA